MTPDTTQQPFLGVVERVTAEFLDNYLKDEPERLAKMHESGNIPGVARLID